MLTATTGQGVDFRHEDRPLQVLFRLARGWAVQHLERATAGVQADLPVLESALARLDPLLSLKSVRARVVAVRDETPDVKTYVLRPNARFGSYRPGAYVTLKVAIDGQVWQRAYSLSSRPSPDGLIAITVKRVPGGRVSNWLADTLKVGAVLELGVAQGQFLLPQKLPPKMLMISAGSGITPLMSMLRQLVAEGAPNELAFMHFARSPADIIFGAELRALAERLPNVRISLCVEEADAAWTGATGRFSQALLEQIAPDFRALETYLCGPSAFMQVVMQTLERAEADLSRLHVERFSLDFNAGDFLEQAQRVRFVRSGRESIASRSRTLLEQAESLGVRIDSSCRVGNCGTCRCTKKSGVVIDITTGRKSGSGTEIIYPCVSLADGTVELDL